MSAKYFITVLTLAVFTASFAAGPASAADLETLKKEYEAQKKKYDEIDKKHEAGEKALVASQKKIDAEFQEVKAAGEALNAKKNRTQAEVDAFNKRNDALKAADAAQRQRTVELDNMAYQKAGIGFDYAEAVVNFILSADNASVSYMWNIIKKGTPSPPEIAGAEAGIAKLLDEETKKFFAGELVSKDISEQAKQIILKALQSLKSSFFIEPLKQLLKESKWEIVSAAALALKFQGDPAAAPGLVEALKKAEKDDNARLSQDLVDALRTLTGKNDFNYASEFETFLQSGTAGDNKPAGKTGELSTYLYGEITSKRVIFIIDRSASMNASGTVPDKITTSEGEEGPYTGEKSEEESAKEAEAPDEEGGVKPGFKGTRLEVLKKEFKYILDKISDDTKFNVISFNHEVSFCFKSLTKVDAKSRAKAWEYIKDMQPDGSTNSFGALEAAIKDREVDTIYFLTDGAPCAGNPRVIDEIIFEVRKLNLTRNIRIHCIALLVGRYTNPMGQTEGENDKTVMERFLRILAKENGGTFKIIRD